MRAATALALLLALGAQSAARAEEAVLLDGRHVRGELLLEPNGRLRFLRPGQPALSLFQLAQVRFAAEPVAPLRAAALHRVRLRNGDELTGAFLSLDEQNLAFRTAWCGRLTVPRRAVAALTQAPGLITFLQDDFEAGLKAWTLTAARPDELPALGTRQHAFDRQSLALGKPGQAATHVLAAPLAAGLAGVNFQDPGGAIGDCRLVRAEFDGRAGPWRVEMALAGEAGCYRAAVPGGRAAGRRSVPRSSGWHRLRIAFTPQSLSVAVDEDLLWFGRPPQPDSSLRKVSLVHEGAAGGVVYFAAFGLARAVEDLPRPPGDPSRDEVWLVAGDQLFGRVIRADTHAITMSGRFGVRTLPWGQVRGIFPQRQETASARPQGERVRVWLRSGAAFEPDHVQGSVRGLDSRRLLLHHDVLGDLEIERKRLNRLGPLPAPLD